MKFDSDEGGLRFKLDLRTGRNRRPYRLNFTLNPPDRLAEGVRRLAAAARSLAQEA